MIKNKINFMIGIVLLAVEVISSLFFGQPLSFIFLFIAMVNIGLGFI